jgi:hypothetical protein
LRIGPLVTTDHLGWDDWLVVVGETDVLLDAAEVGEPV